MRPFRARACASASAIRRGLGVAEGDESRSALRQFHLVALRRKRRGDDIGRRGRAADAGIAVDDERLRRGPSFARNRAVSRTWLSPGGVMPSCASAMSCMRQEEVVARRRSPAGRMTVPSRPRAATPAGARRSATTVSSILRQRTDIDHRRPPRPCRPLPHSAARPVPAAPFRFVRRAGRSAARCGNPRNVRTRMPGFAERIEKPSGRGCQRNGTAPVPP